MKKRFTHLDAVQGRAEERIEMYLMYFEGVPQALTPQCARSASGATS